MLEREWIEDFRRMFIGRPDEGQVNMLCTLALERLAMEPMPIAEAPEDKWCLVYDSNSYFTHGWSIRTLRDFKDVQYQVSKQWVDEYSQRRLSLTSTHFIPISSLQKVPHE